MTKGEINLIAQRAVMFIIGFIVGAYIVGPWLERVLGL